MSDDDLKAIQQKGFIEVRPGVFEKPKRGVSSVCAAPPTKPEPIDRKAEHGVVSREAIYPGRVSVLIKSYVCGTIRDPDNILQKFAIDCLRYAGIIRNDTRACVILEPIEETRVSTKREEGFEIVITPL